MKKNNMIKLFSLMMSVMLIAVMAFTGCAKEGNNDVPETTTTASVTTAETTAETTSAVTEAPEADVTVMGEGATVFHFVTADLDGNKTYYEIHTDKKTVGEALVDNKLVEGTVGEWGLMVETVNGITLDFNKDGMYWAFYINDEYAQTGVDSTEIKAGDTYSFAPAK